MKRKYDIHVFIFVLGPFITGVGMGISLYEDNMAVWVPIVFLGMGIGVLGYILSYKSGLNEFIQVTLKKELIAADNDTRK